MKYPSGRHLVLTLSLIGLFMASPGACLSLPIKSMLLCTTHATPEAKQLKPALKGQSEEEAVERDVQQALLLLTQALASVKELTVPADRIRSYLAIAEALWDVDPPRARTLFRQAVDEVERIPKEKKVATPRTPIVSQRSPDLLRREILRRAATLDPALATELAKRVPDETEKQPGTTETSPPSNATDPSERAEKLLALALMMVDNDPTRAAALARSSLASGVRPNFIGLICELRKRHRQLADELYHTALPMAVAQARQDMRGLFLLGSYAVPGIPLPFRFGLEAEATPVDSALAQQYVAILVDVLAAPDEMAGAAASSDWLSGPASRYALLQQLQPLIARYAPEKVPVVEAALEGWRIQLAQQGRPVPESRSSSDGRSAEEQIGDLVAQAERTPSPDEHDSLLVRAIDLAVTNKLLDRARKLAPQVNDLTLRGELNDYVSYVAATQAADTNDIEAAKNYATEIRQPERMTLAFIHIAHQSRNDRDVAMAVLNDAAQRIHRLQTSSEKARSLVRLAEAMLPLEAARAFELLAAAIPVFNATDAPIEVIDGVAFVFKTKRYTKAVRLSQVDLSGAIEKLMRSAGQKDVNLALLLSGQWTKPELRILAQVAAARGIIEETRKPGERRK